MHPLRTAVRDALAVVALCGAVGLGFNAWRPSGIAIVQRDAYEILVPCPETAGEVERVDPRDPRVGDARTLLVDARSRADYERSHPAGALHVPFDYLEPTAPAALRQIASSGAARVIVYGDGGDPDSGEQLAREIAGKGIRNVGFVAGGARAFDSRPPDGGAP